MAATAAMPSGPRSGHRPASVATMPALRQLTRTLGAHSMASDWVRLIRPALAAP